LLGVALALAMAGVQPNMVIGSAALLVGIAAVVYRPALGLAVLALTYPFDLTTWAGPVKLTTSAALIGLLLTIWLVRNLLADRFHWGWTALDLPVLVFAAATGLSL